MKPAKPVMPMKSPSPRHTRTSHGKLVPHGTHNPANRLEKMPGFKNGGMVKKGGGC